MVYYPQKVTRYRASTARYREARNDVIHTLKRKILHESSKH